MTDDEKKKLRLKELYAQRRAMLEADPEKMAAYRQQIRDSHAKQKAKREADPERMAAFKAASKRAAERMKAKREADPERMAAFRQQLSEQASRAKEKREADPERMAAYLARKAKERERKKAERAALQPAEEPPRGPRMKQRPVPVIEGPIIRSSPEDCDYSAAPSIPAPVHKIEPSLGPVPKRTGWKPSERFQAILDASNADPNRLDKTICLQPDHVAAQEDKATWKHATTKEEREERYRLAQKKYRDQRRLETIAMNGTPKRGRPSKPLIP